MGVFASMCVCAPCVCLVSTETRRPCNKINYLVSDPLEMELKTFVSCHVGAGN